MFGFIIKILRSGLQALQARSDRVSALRRFALATLSLPLFATIYTLLKLRQWLIGPWRVEAVTIDGAKFVCRPPDLIQMYLHLFGTWEPDVTAFVRRRLRQGDGFIDVGANIGYYVELASRLVGSAGQVVAIEASPRITVLLKETIQRNGREGNVRVVNQAAAKQRGELNLYSGPVHNIGLTTTVASRGFQHETMVESAPLHELLQDGEIAKARIVKIDVEGAEPDVLDGMAGFVRLFPDDVEILLELSPHWWSGEPRNAQQILQPFFDAGFHAYQIDNNLWPWRYLWPNAVRPPRRIRDTLSQQAGRIDLVLSRVNANCL